MEYNYFLGMARQYESNKIKVIASNHKCCAVEQIPKPFVLLLGNILSIIESKSFLVCKSDEVIRITSFQPASQMICSNKPCLSNRILDKKHNWQHFCCTLDYYITVQSQTEYNQESSDSCVVDFTTGELMDKEAYLAKLYENDKDKESLGHIYGKINQQILETSWKMVKLRRLKR